MNLILKTTCRCGGTLEINGDGLDVYQRHEAFLKAHAVCLVQKPNEGDSEGGR